MMDFRPLQPLSTVILPLVDGLTRRYLLRSGVVSQRRPLAGVATHFYRADPQPVASDLPIVLIHGIADSALTWWLMLRPLTRVGGPVYAVDLPGFGLSGFPSGRRYATIAEQTAVIAALIREEIGRPALLIGNSMGGWVAARLAARSPELVRGIVLLDPGGAMLEGRSSWESFVANAAVPDLRTVRLIYRQMFRHVPAPLYLAQHGFRSLFLRDPVTQFVAAAEEGEFFQGVDLEAIDVPVGLVWGDCDTFLPAGSFEFFQRHLPQAEVLLLKGCGHLPQREQPRPLLRFIERFVQEKEIA